MHFSFYTRFLLLLLSTTISAVISTGVGITYNPSTPKVPPPDQVSSAIQSLHFPAVRLLDPTPLSIRTFANTKISLLVSIPNHLIPSFAANRSAARAWLQSHVIPYHRRTHFSLISVGSSAYDDVTADPSTILILAVRNVYLSLQELGIYRVPVSTTFSFIDIMTTSFPPSSAQFQEPINSLVTRPLLQFLAETSSSFLINLYPNGIHITDPKVPLGFALFRENQYIFRDDDVAGVRHRNLFDMMVDAVIAAMEAYGHENIPVIVTETGWPTTRRAERKYAEPAEIYLKRLVKHLRSKMGSRLRKKGVAEAYIYQLFDGDVENFGISSSTRSMHWGIMYNNMSLKYKIDFSHSVGRDRELVEMVLGWLLLVAGVCFAAATVKMN